MTRFAEREMKRLMGKAIYKYGMTEEGDHILVSVSGGKDSMSLLWLLRERIQRIPIDYRITAVHVDPGFGNDSAARMADFFENSGFDYKIITGDFGPKAHSPENRENPCFFCSRQRRKAVFELAGELNCNKIALGHHKDDMIETFFLNILFGASVSTMMPVQDFFNGKIRAIRPMFMIDEDIISKYFMESALPAIELGCPSAGVSKRYEIRKLLHDLYRTNKKIKGNIFHALQNVRPEYLL
ncbi:MAG: tRNA 2-thiocytidine(32) synthetase TtcA [Deltaproteobacteria bacterium]|nr:tRNA 2-thiocytidine(32) synthetase TtcA [Deltaproteobacteria bacterium]